MPVVLKSGSFNLLEPSGPVQRFLYVFLLTVWVVKWQFFLNVHYTFSVIIVGLKLLHFQHLWLWLSLKVMDSPSLLYIFLLFDIWYFWVWSPVLQVCVNRLIGKSCMINRLHDSQNCSVICTRLSITNKIQFINKQFIRK